MDSLRQAKEMPPAIFCRAHKAKSPAWSEGFHKFVSILKAAFYAASGFHYLTSLSHLSTISGCDLM